MGLPFREIVRGHEATRFAALTIQAEVAHDLMPLPPGVGVMIAQAVQPAIEANATEIFTALASNETTQASQEAGLAAICMSQCALVREESRGGSLQSRERAHAAPPVRAIGTGSATSRNTSVCSRRYTAVLTMLPCPIKSPIALIPTPRAKRRIAKECRRE